MFQNCTLNTRMALIKESCHVLYKTYFITGYIIDWITSGLALVRNMLFSSFLNTAGVKSYPLLLVCSSKKNVVWFFQLKNSNCTGQQPPPLSPLFLHVCQMHNHPLNLLSICIVWIINDNSYNQLMGIFTCKSEHYMPNYIT